MNDLINEIRRIKEIFGYENILNESIVSSIADNVVIDAIKAALKTEVDNVIRDAVKKGTSASVNTLNNAKRYFKSIKLDSYSDNLFNKVLNNLPPEKVKELQQFELSAIRSEVGKIIGGQVESSKGVYDDIIQKSIKANTFSAAKSSRLITKPIQDAVEQAMADPKVAAEAGEIATRNPRLKIGLTNAANAVRQASSPDGKSLVFAAGTTPPINRVLPQLADAGLTQTTKKGIEITTKNLKKAAFLIGSGTLALALIGYLLDNGVTVQDDSADVDTTSCLSNLQDSTNYPGLKYSRVGSSEKTTLGYYYDSGAYYMIDPFTKTQYPKGSNTYYRFYCQGKTVVPTKEIVDINGKPFGSTDDGENKVRLDGGGEGGGNYSGGERKWRSMGRSYDSQILTALGKTGSDTLTDDDIKDIYNKLKAAGKIKE
jgi:hypothetical protein